MTDFDSIPVLAIDGPSGAGKGTISANVANTLGWHLLDSGALYRAVGYAATSAGLDLTDADSVSGCAEHVQIEFRPTAGGVHVWVDGADTHGALRTERCGAAASAVAGFAGVRRALLDKQRSMRSAPGLVADGRDMGTVVFPDALCKVFLTASAEERAGRRYKQLKAKGLDVKLSLLLQDIKARDARDASRALAPLRPAADAILVDTTHMAIATVTEKVLFLVHQALA